MKICVVVRTRDDEPFLQTTLERVRAQAVPTQVLVMSNNSGNRPPQPHILKLADRVVLIPDGEYRPGAVLNQAMEITSSEIVVFLNADCVPQNSGWLKELVSPIQDREADITFGCQVPRANCYPPLARDTTETFGDGRHQERWRNCFSMALSALRRDVWESVRFDPDLRYSEDIAWSLSVKSRGFKVQYTAHSVVEHSHNYTLAQFYRRQKGEGVAEASIFTWNRWRSSLLRYSLLPLFRQVWRDTMFCLSQNRPGWVLASIAYRVVGTLGRRRGFLQGRRK